MAGYDPRVVADYIRQAAMKRGMDPDVALQVAKNEGLGEYVGDGGSSFGPFQLHYGGVAKGGNAVGGLGDIFTKRTGLDARNPDTWQAQVDFSLDEAKRGGWTPWHGWKGPSDAGIRGKYGGPLIGAKGVPTAARMPGADIPVEALAYSEGAKTAKSDPIGELLAMIDMQQQQKPAVNLTQFVTSLLAEPASQEAQQPQANSTDDAFFRQMMDFHNAQHMRAVKGLL